VFLKGRVLLASLSSSSTKALGKGIVEGTSYGGAGKVGSDGDSDDDEISSISKIYAYLPQVRKQMVDIQDAVCQKFPRLNSENLSKLQSIVVENCIGDLLSYIRIAYVQHYLAADEKLNDIISKLNCKKEKKEKMESKSALDHREDKYRDAVRTLRRLPTRHGPGEKLACLIKSFRRLTKAEAILEAETSAGASRNVAQRRLGCDRMCEGFRSLLVLAGVPDIIWQIHFTRDLMGDDVVGSEGDYILTTILGLVAILVS